ncbi:MAG: Hpt domain-containing protein, partial [Gammaproteobacteria bacterium]
MDCDGSVAEIFLMESKDLLSKIENVLLKMEKGEKNPDFINSIFRSAHTLKGAAAMFDFKELSTFAHEIENLLSVCRNTNIVINAKQINVLIEAVDCLNNLLEESVKKDIKEATILHKQQIIQNLKAAESNIVPVVIPAVENKTQVDKILENKIQTDKIQEHIDPNNEEEKKKTITSTKIDLNPANNKKISTEENVNEVVKNFIKVEANKLDEIINLIGEIVIMQAHLNNLIKENKIT